MINRPAHRRLLAVIALGVLFLTLTVPAAAAYEPTNIEINDYTVIDESYTLQQSSSTIAGNNRLYGFSVKNIGNFTNPHSIVIAKVPQMALKNPDLYAQTVECKYFYKGNQIGDGYLSYYRDIDNLNNYYVIVFENWDKSLIGLDTGLQSISISYDLDAWNIKTVAYRYTDESSGAVRLYNDVNLGIAGTYTYNSIQDFKHCVMFDPGEVLCNITIQKEFGLGYSSHVIVKSLVKSTPYIDEVSNLDRTINVPISDAPYEIAIYATQTSQWYNYTVYEDDVNPPQDGDPGDESGITVYIKNSQTGALIANANVVLDALVDGEYYPVTNRTEPSGIFSINLQPTGGGKPNPDGYRLIVTADGYNNPMPEINFTLGDYRKYFECFLDPIAGGPADENKTFIDFFVRDMSSNPISGATVKFGKYTLITNSAGYTVFEVDKNNNYSWTVSKSGYGPLTGNAVIGDDPRHTINTVLAPIVTPTTTTPIPTSPPIGPTPTMTAPTGEPVSNWLEWFAAHFGMILGGGVEIGKIFMWLCFTVPVGVYVGKESKAGAAGFMAGAGIVTLFFVLIGWVPIWLVVLLALIIGLLYAKEFNSPNNGGGR